jgi:hypothetical protein
MDTKFDTIFTDNPNTLLSKGFIANHLETDTNTKKFFVKHYLDYILETEYIESIEKNGETMYLYSLDKDTDDEKYVEEQEDTQDTDDERSVNKDYEVIFEDSNIDLENIDYKKIYDQIDSDIESYTDWLFDTDFLGSSFYDNKTFFEYWINSYYFNPEKFFSKYNEHLTEYVVDNLIDYSKEAKHQDTLLYLLEKKVNLVNEDREDLVKIRQDDELYMNKVCSFFIYGAYMILLIVLALSMSPKNVLGNLLFAFINPVIFIFIIGQRNNDYQCVEHTIAAVSITASSYAVCSIIN